jgi:hypothetical protein
MRKNKITTIIIATALLLAPLAALGGWYEEGGAWTYQGEYDAIVRHPGYHGAVEGIDAPHIELEVGSPYGSVHMVGTPQDARGMAQVLLDAADAAEEPVP